jgi:hypothetical protein
LTRTSMINHRLDAVTTEPKDASSEDWNSELSDLSIQNF